MRKLRTSIVLLGISSSTSVLAQPDDPAAEVTAPVEAESAPEAEPIPEPEPAPEPVAPVAEPAPAAAPAASASASTGGGVGGIIQMGDSGDGPSTRGAGASSSSMGSYGGPQSASEDEWKFGFNGYFRAPMRVGIGERIEAKTDQSKTTLSIPQIPNDQYLDWQFTKSVQRSWLESFFSYGNSWAKGVFAIQAFRFSDSAWPDPEAQFGVGQAWVELTPDMSSIDDDMRLVAKVGSFWGRYGGAGQYDAGAYDTFIIGRTHTIGESVRVEYDYNDFVFFVEEGFGTKQPNPNPFHNTKFTLLARGHAGFEWDQFLSLGIHYMHSWTQEQDHDCQSREEEVAYYADVGIPDRLAEFAEGPVGACKHESAADNQTAAGGFVRRSDTPDGSLAVLGFDAVLNTGSLGRIFIGGSRVFAKHAVTVDNAIEVIHAYGGGFFKSGVTHQYLVEKSQWDDYTVMNRGGNGHVDTAELQWDLSLSSLIGPELFGQQQLDLQLFGMLNMIKSDDSARLDGVSKLKYGADLLYSLTGWFGIGVRGDRVEPRSDIPEQSFSVLTPRLVFRSGFGSHEQIHIGYARYFYAQRECDGSWLHCTQVPGAVVGPDGFGNRPGINSSKNFRGTPVDVNSSVGPFNATAGAIQGWDPPHEDVFFVSADIWW